VRELRFIGLDKAVIVNRLRAHMAVEIAIRTFGEAKRPMHIDPEPGSGPILLRGDIFNLLMPSPARGSFNLASISPGNRPPLSGKDAPSMIRDVADFWTDLEKKLREFQQIETMSDRI